MKRLFLISISLFLCNVGFSQKTDAAKEGFATVVLTAGDIWGDNTGYQLLLDADANTSESVASESESFGRLQASHFTYVQYEYMIPLDADPTGNNIILNSSRSISIPAGTYDYLVLNPSGSSLWIPNQDPFYNGNGVSPIGYSYSFEANKTYVFTMLDYGANDSLVITVIDESEGPKMLLPMKNLSLKAIIGESELAFASVLGYNLMEEITVTTVAPFSVSADGETFAESCNISADGGSLIVKYTPSEVGTQNANVIVSVGDLIDSIAVVGEGSDCSEIKTNPYSETFVAKESSEYCWTVVNANNDSQTFQLGWSNVEHTDMLYAIKYNMQKAANDWLISPKLRIGNNDEIAFSYNAGKTEGYETSEIFSVWVISESPSNYVNGTLLIGPDTVEGNNNWTNMSKDISAFAGQDVYIGINCTSEAGQDYFYIDNFELRSKTSVSEYNENKILIYPNPANEFINICGAENQKIEILNIVGSVVATIENAKNNEHIDVSSFTNGIYFARTSNGVTKFNVFK